MTVKQAAVYLRSSKDRSDVSIDAQRRELTSLAQNRGFIITAEYVDTVESAKTEDRPAYQKLVRDLAQRDRPWSVILAVDTSRIARRVVHAYVFEYECQKRGVDIVFSKMPETDRITSVILEAVFRAFDEIHSLMSRDKGLAGMKENVARGWRAGGRAPWGYRLEHTETATIRQGEPVRKSRLVPDAEASVVSRYLKRRAAGEPRARICADMGIEKSVSTLVCVEWNALTYAGFTVWNVHAEKLSSGKGYKGGHKRRPRDEWVIQPDTHEALITVNEAETLVTRLQDSDNGQRVSSAKAGQIDTYCPAS